MPAPEETARRKALKQATNLGKNLLALAGWWNLAFAGLHVVIIAMGGAGYRYFGAGEQMARAAEAGDPRPTIVTAGSTVMFAFFGLYLLAAAGKLRQLPWARFVALGIGILYLLRGILVAPQARWAWQYPQQVPLRFVFFSGVALLLGLATFYGALLRWSELRPPKG